MDTALPAQHATDILILLGIVGLTIPFLQRLNISPVLGFLLCGLVAGPYGVPAAWQALGFDFPAPIHDSAIIHTFGELGIMFLMFVIGLKLSWKDLWHMRRHIAGLGTCQILVTTLAVSVIAYAFGNPLALSILLGACFALSSTAVVMQLFEERRMVHSPVGKVSFSILLMQDLAVVPILTMLPILTGNGPDHIVMLMLKALLLAVAMIGGIYVIGVRVLGPLLRYLHPGDQPEWLMSFVLFLVIGTAMLTESAGLSSALGAFLAGVLLAETEYRDRIQTIIAPVKGLLLGVFFLSVGLIINPAMALEHPVWIVLSIIGIGLLKAGITYALCRAFKVAHKTALPVAVLLGQSGEFVFVIIALALTRGVIGQADAQFFMIVTALSMMITPVIEKLLYRYQARTT